MKKVGVMLILLSVFFWAGIYPVYGQLQTGPCQAKTQVKTVDVNKDGKHDITYHSDGKYVSKIEADTNYDGKPDVTVRLKDGKFHSAEADTDHDGKTDKKFTSAGDFNKWLNENNPDFNDKLDKADWQFDMLKF